MKPFALILVASLVISNVAARAREPDPLSTVQALVDAEQAFDIDRAMSLFADEAVIVNAAGAVTTGADDLKRFVDEDMWYNGSLVLQQPAVNGNRVSWTDQCLQISTVSSGWRLSASRSRPWSRTAKSTPSLLMCRRTKLPVLKRLAATVPPSR